jgi:hypothetical protein
LSFASIEKEEAAAARKAEPDFLLIFLTDSENSEKCLGTTPAAFEVDSDISRIKFFQALRKKEITLLWL